MPPFLNQLSRPTYDPGVVSEDDQYAVIKKIAKEQDYFDPGNLLFGAAGGMPMVAGSIAKGRIPMRLERYEPESEQGLDRFGDQKALDYARYRFRNKLGDPKFRAETEMILNPETKHAHLGMYQVKGEGKRSNEQYYGTGINPHSGGTPTQYKAMMTRLAEEIQGAGYTSVSGDPITQGRKAIAERTFKQLKSQGIIDPKTEIKLSDPGPTGRYESPGMAGVLRRREVEYMERLHEGMRRTGRTVDTDFEEPIAGETPASQAANRRLQANMQRIRQRVRSQDAPNDYDEELANLQGTPPDPTIHALNRFRRAAGHYFGPDNATPRGQEWRAHVEMLASEQAARDNMNVSRPEPPPTSSNQTYMQWLQAGHGNRVDRQRLSEQGEAGRRLLAQQEQALIDSRNARQAGIAESHRLARLARPRD